MKKFFTLLFGLCLSIGTLQAQEIDESFVFMDEEGEIIPNGATVVCNVAEPYDDASEVIYSGISVLNVGGSTDYIKMTYVIERIDNGTYQNCFPSTCNMQTVTGTYQTGVGQLMADLQDIQSDWFPVADGECIVTLAIELFTKQGLFPPSYVHKAYGPSVTIRFVKSSSASDDGFPYLKLADGVYLDGTTLYICSGVTSLGDLQINPSEIYCYATMPPACLSNTFSGYGATLHVPASGMVSYFTALYWYNFNNILSDAIEPLSVTMNTTDAEVGIGQQLSLSATVAPGDATPKTVYWSSTDTSVAKVSSGGTVTAVAVGECDILATCVDKVAVCHVTVVPPRVTVTLDKHEARLLPNHTITLTASCSPIDVELAVSSSHPGVAIPRIVNGSIMVVGVSEGTATITVNTADGEGNPDTCKVTVYTEPGDVNSDGYVNISDVTALIDYLLSGNPQGLSAVNADTNVDRKVNISDVTFLIDYLLSGRWPWTHDPRDYVDLGLPSGTLWATCNVGASTPEEYGDYFAWGETAPKNYYAWTTYRWCEGNYNKLTKYCTNNHYSAYGYGDGRAELEPADDAAYVNWGPSWRMPTIAQQNELREECNCIWTMSNGVNGLLVTGPNGNTIFLPATGSIEGSTLKDEGSTTKYWSRTLWSLYPSGAQGLQFEPTNVYYYSYDRCDGLPVRAVRVP